MYFVTRSWAFPHGEGDAFAIWNLRARFLYYSGAEWMRAFSPILEFSHTDYPLLVPLSVVRGWMILGQEHVVVSIVLAFFYTSGTAYLLFLMTRSTDWHWGLVSMGLLLMQPNYVRMGASQMADIPLAFYMLLSVALWRLTKESSPWSTGLVGVSLGCALWTKNEGALFTLVFVVSLLAQRTGRQRFWAWVLGLLPSLVSYLLFKGIVPTPNDLIAGQGEQTLNRLMDVSRYLQIAAAYMMEGWFVLITLGGIAFYSLAQRPHLQPPRETFILWLITAMLAGYFFVFLTTPAPLDWHLDTALDRLLMQVTPLILLYGGLWLGNKSRHEPLRSKVNP
ncbi:MAG: phospholipid carrier-dependent glycosyltransferase [Anaerolineae bacterium]|nr:phospholipid carrier-dependent glycosyltransferase [Anaerolineae bacterium]